MMACVCKTFYGFWLQFGRVEDVWPWMKEVVFPVVYPSHHYNGDSMSLYERQFMYNIDALRMGPVRMKQNREIESKLHCTLIRYHGQKMERQLSYSAIHFWY